MQIAVALGLATAVNGDAALLTGVTATASSELSSFGRTVDKLLDGLADGGSVWETSGVGFSSSNDLDPWVLFDLQEAKTLGKMTVINFPEPLVAINQMLVEVSLDNVSFSSLGVFNLINDGAFLPFDHSLGNAVGRYVRFDILSNHGGSVYPIANPASPGGYVGFAGLAEVSFFGETYIAPPPPPPTGVPDTGSSVALLGLGVAGLVGICRGLRQS